MQMDWISTFIDVSDTRNFNRTASNLGITQSTVSSRIRSLESALQTRLFERGRGGATLTIEGEQFLKHAHNLRQNWNLATHELSRPTSPQGILRISVQLSIWEQFVNQWLTQMRNNFSQTAIHLEVDYSKNMVEELLQGVLDMAVLYTPEYRPTLEVEHLFNDRFVMISSTNQHIDEITPENYVFVALTEYFKARHRELLPHLQTASVTMGLSIVSHEYLKTNQGAAYTSERQARALVESGDFFLVSNAPIIEQPVFISYLSQQRHKPIFVESIKLLRKIISDDTGL